VVRSKNAPLRKFFIFFCLLSLANQGAEFTVGSSKIENTKTYIAGSIADMLSLLVDVDENVPKEEGAFQKVEDERVKADCNFRKVCD
jgi:hypothetical protein